MAQLWTKSSEERKQVGAAENVSDPDQLWFRFLYGILAILYQPCRSLPSFPIGLRTFSSWLFPIDLILVDQALYPIPVTQSANSVLLIADPISLFTVITTVFWDVVFAKK